VTLPIDHVVLASAVLEWEPVAGTDYAVLSVLYDPEKRTMRIILEGTGPDGDEVRSVFYWDPTLSEWVANDYKRIHTMLVPLDWDESEWEDAS